MSILVEINSTVFGTNVWFEDNMLCVTSSDGRQIRVPTFWFPRLYSATPQKLKNWTFIGKGQGIHWPDLDEDLSIKGLLNI